MRALPQKLLDSLHIVDCFNEKAFLEAHQQPAVVSVRLHPKKHAAVFSSAHPIPWCKEGFYLGERPVFTLDPLYHAGAYYVQEASSMFLDYLIKQALPERGDLRVLDLCAAPGGKSTLLASLLAETSLLVSNEVIRTRAPILEENVVRWGYTNNWVTSNDPKDFSRLAGYFDLVVVDAPCSGSGLFRKDERALTSWSEANVQLCSQRQQRIIADVWPALKEDGFLVYATCSYSPEEDEAILDWLATEFSVVPVPVSVPEAWGVVSTVNKRGLIGYRFFPDRLVGEGFFVALVQKKEATDSFDHPKHKSFHEKKLATQTARLLHQPEAFTVLQHKNEFVALRSAHESDFQLLQKTLYLRKAGVALGVAANKDWLPAHELALSVDKASGLPSVAVSKEQALKFLKKEDMGLPQMEKGWMLISYNGHSLGWIKSLSNRVNNYLPKHWRIRMELPSEWD